MTTEDGEAVLTYTGPDDPDTTTDDDNMYDCIVAQWEALGDYEDEGTTDTDSVIKDWNDDEGGFEGRTPQTVPSARMAVTAAAATPGRARRPCARLAATWADQGR